jgi:hypothetical protein
VRGLEEINAGRNHFQERHVSMADASRSTAENIRSILQAIREVKSMVNDLPTAADDDESTALERESYDGTKTDLLQQLTNAREKERMRQRGSVSDEGDQQESFSNKMRLVCSTFTL